MEDNPVGSILLFLALLILSGYFSGTEISLASVNKIHMMSKASGGSNSAKRVLKILDNFDKALTTLLIGNNIVNISLATVSAAVADRIWGVRAAYIAAIAAAVVIFIFGEMLPKSFAHSCNERFAQWTSGSLLVLMKVFKPLSVFFTAISSLALRPFKNRSEARVTITEDEINNIVENISEADGFDEDTGRLVKSALKFSEKSVGEVMIEWDKVQKISSSLKTPQILEIVKSSVHSRIPVTDRKGNLKGILQIRKYLKAYAKYHHNIVLASVTDYPYFVLSSTPIDEALTAMSNHRRNLAVVKDEYSNILGIITVEDILEELVGEISDEDDEGGALNG